MKFFMLVLGFLFSTSVMAANVDVKLSTGAGLEDYHSYDFGTVWLHSRANVRFTVTNTGTVPLNFRDAYTMGSDFRGYHNCNTVLVPGARCSFEIEYWPMFEGMSSGRFVLNFVEDYVEVSLWGRAQRM